MSVFVMSCPTAIHNVPKKCMPFFHITRITDYCAGGPVVAFIAAVASGHAVVGGPSVAEVPVVAGLPCSCWVTNAIAGVSFKPGAPAVCLHGPGPLSVCIRHRYQTIVYEH